MGNVMTVTLQTPESCEENVQTGEVAACAGKGKNSESKEVRSWMSRSAISPVAIPPVIQVSILPCWTRCACL